MKNAIINPTKLAIFSSERWQTLSYLVPTVAGRINQIFIITLGELPIDKQLIESRSVLGRTTRLLAPVSFLFLVRSIKRPFHKLPATSIFETYSSAICKS
jgi:hypothetical protein